MSRVGPIKREISFLTAGTGYKKKRETNNIASQSWQNKDKVLKPADKSMNLMNLKMNLI